MENNRFTDKDTYIKINKDLEDLFIGVYGKTVGIRKFGSMNGSLHSVSGYLTIIQVFSMCIEASKEAKQAEVEAKMIKEQCESSIKNIIESRQKFEKEFEKRFIECHQNNVLCINGIDHGLENSDYSYTVMVLTNFADQLSIKLKMADFFEFDDFMNYSDGPLKL
jgi:hypothetical protein